jgi:nicotinamidase-related amidase
MKALVIIDMQNGSFVPNRSTFDTEGVISRINKLSDYFRAEKNPVIFIQHNGTKENCYIPDSNDWQILQALKRVSGDITIQKEANDSFYRSDLQQVLVKNKIDELIITGYATDFCVDTTIRSALNKDLKVVVVKDGHTTFNRSFLDAETIIRHHNLVWENLVPTKYKVKVIPFDELIIELKDNANQ